MSLVVIGFIRTAWGVKGWVKVSSYTGEWEHFSVLREVVLRKGSREKVFPVEGFRILNKAGAFKFKGVDNPETGKTLAGWEILVPREMASPLGEEEWYLADLIGFSLVGEGQVYGEIKGFIETSDDLLEIERPQGGRFFVPFRKEFLGIPDFEKSQIEFLAPWLAEV